MKRTPGSSKSQPKDKALASDRAPKGGSVAPKKRTPRKEPVKPRRRVGRWVGLGLLTTVIAGATADYHLFPRYAQPTGPSRDHGENGLWLRYRWYFGLAKPADVDGLVRRLKANGISEAYFHVRSMKADGTLAYHYGRQARQLNDRLAEKAPDTKRLAWIYVGKDTVELARPEIRRQMVKEADWLVETCGFDGVQWDYEPCPDQDSFLWRLLEETRKALPKDAVISVAAPVWMPIPFNSLGWSSKGFAEAAKRCDSLCVMAYDTGAYFPRLYTSFVARNVAEVTRAVGAANPRCRVVIGLPTYGQGLRSHNPKAENLKLGLIGVRDGLAKTNAHPEVLAGVALFADYTTTADDWQTYRSLWRR